METVIKKFDKMLHGGDYNPDQWLNYPEILEKDIEYMKKANVNAVSLNIFGWSTLEPSEGEYNIQWLEDIINNLYANGIYTVLATPSGAMPNWLTNKYPEVLQVRENGVRNLPGRRHNFCYTSKVFRVKIAKVNKVLGSAFAKHPAVIMWHISNELGGNKSDASCHCENCQKAFRQWLKEKYGTLDALNHAWWSTFWSHTYTEWDQINSPQIHGEMILHGLNLDWKRFVTHQMIDYYNAECDVVKSFNLEIPVTTNFMTYFKPLDYYKFAEKLDIVSFDSYPNWHSENDVAVAVSTAVNLNIMRSIKKSPFILMESTPTLVNWQQINRNKRENVHMLSSIQAIAHGSNSVMYFQWRQGRGSFEKFHGAVLDHYGKDDTKVFQNVTEVGERLNLISDDLYKTINKPEVAIIMDWENWWALDDAAGPRKDMEYTKVVEDHYRTFWENGIDVDIIDMTHKLDDYKLVIAPMCYMYKAEFADNIRNFVSKGGNFVTTYWSGIVDETDLCFLGGAPGLIKDILGIRFESIDALTNSEKISVEYNKKIYTASRLVSTVVDVEANILGKYMDDSYRGAPAVTKNKYNEGNAFYICSENDREFMREFYNDVIAESNIEKNIDCEIPMGVTINKRIGEQEYYFIQNYNNYEVSIKLPKKYLTVENNSVVEGVAKLKPYDAIILKDY